MECNGGGVVGIVAERHEEPIISIDEAEGVLEQCEDFIWEDWMGRQLTSVVWVDQKG